VPRHINKLCNRLLVLGYGKGTHILDEEEVRAISGELREEQLTPLGNARQTSDEISATCPGGEPGGEAITLTELALDRNSVEVEDADLPLSPVPMPREETYTAARKSQQTAQWRVQARTKVRRENQQHPGETGCRV
jgi:hypothetical protein